jgi:hypothetical protein
LLPYGDEYAHDDPVEYVPSATEIVSVTPLGITQFEANAVAAHGVENLALDPTDSVVFENISTRFQYVPVSAVGLLLVDVATHRYKLPSEPSTQSPAV